MNGCSGRQNSPGSKNKQQALSRKVPKRIQKLDYLHVHSAKVQPPDTVILKKTGIFKSTSNVYLNGFIGSMAVDDQNRVYIAAGKPHTAASVYVFAPDGRFLRKIGRLGRGPGEFLTISTLRLRHHKLYVFDPLQFRISVFSLADFKLLDTIIIHKNDHSGDKARDSFHAGPDMFVLEDGGLLQKFTSYNFDHQGSKMYYYYIDSTGQTGRHEVLSVKKHRTYMDGLKKTGAHTVMMPFTLPFNRNSYVAVSRHDSIFTTWSNDFLVKIHEPDGAYRRAIYYTYSNPPLDLSALDISEDRRAYLNDDNVPDTWPALRTIFFDDQNRLWAITFTRRDNYYKAWVMNTRGRLLARFNWSGDRREAYIKGKLKVVVNNGFLYKIHIDIRKGLNQVEKYKIQFKKNR